MNILTRFFHRLKALSYARRAARLQRDLAEYVLIEESHITFCLHRAAWHLARSGVQPQHRLEAQPVAARVTAPGRNGHKPSTTAPAERDGAARVDDATIRL
ncbi:MAG: hypothetical protein PHC88_08250 [Terrimicrobiaceae bacterium]|nr:hypothetical protein [Terrimicrobiaceae bacterium]